MYAEHKKHVIKSAARSLGFELLKADCRMNFFHIKRDQEVRLGFFWRDIDVAQLNDAVERASKYGDRLDIIAKSRYYSA